MAILALTAIVLIWGYNWVVVKVALRYSSSSDYAALRILIGLMSLLVVFISSRKPLLPRKEVFGIFLTGVLQTGGFYVFSTWALVSGGVGKTVVLNYAMPFWVLLLAWFALGERLRRTQRMGVASFGTLATPVVGVLAAWIQLGETPTFLEAVGMVLIIGALVLNSIQAVKPQKQA